MTGTFQSDTGGTSIPLLSQNVIDLTKATFGELEDCAYYKGDLYIQAQGDLFRLTF